MNETSQVISAGANGSSVSVRALRALEHRHARVAAEPRVQLAVADVERDHARSAALEQHVGEPARRGADVEAVETLRVDAERVERVRELDARARDVRRRPLDLERRLVVDLLPRLRMAGHEPRHHEGLRLRAALGEAALDEQDVESLASHDVRAASRATISASTEVSAGIAASRDSARAAASSASSRDRVLSDLDRRIRPRRGCRRRPGRAARARPRTPATGRARRSGTPAAQTPHMIEAENERPGLQPVELGQIVAALEIHLLAADHPERRLDELARDVGRRR